MVNAKFILSNYVKSEFLNTGRKAGNCSYFYKDGKQYLITRETDYVYGKVLPGTATAPWRTGDLQMYEENDNVNIVHSHEALYEKNGTTLKFIKYITKAEGNDWGFEDPRAVNWNDAIWLMFSRRKLGQWQKFQLNTGRLTENFTFENKFINDGKQLIEKNWQPIEDRPGMCVYSTYPFQLINVFNNTYTDVKNNFPLLLRGSSNIIKYKENYLGINHVRNEKFEYLHYIILYDKDFNVLKMSEPFSFFGANVEFNCYAEYKDDKLTVPVSVHDQLIYEFIIDDVLLNKILDHTLIDAKKDNEVFTRFYFDAKASKNIFAALVIAGFSFNPDVLYDAAILNHNAQHFRNNIQRSILQKLYYTNYGK